MIILKARRHRISTLMAANIFHGCVFNKNKRGYIVAHDVDTTDTLFKMHKTFYENLDDKIAPMMRLSNRKELLFENPDSSTRKSNPGLRSSITVRAASSGGKRVGAEQGAAGVGRGDRIDYLHGSEVAFWANGQETFTGFAQAVPEEPGTMVVCESTANGMAGYFYEAWLQANEVGANGYTPIFIPWFEHPHYTGTYVARTREEWRPSETDEKLIEEYRGNMFIDNRGSAERIANHLKLDQEEEVLINRFGVSWDQVLWRRWCIKFRCRGKAEVFHVEYPSFPEEAFASSGIPRFNNEKLRGWVDMCVPPSSAQLSGPKDWDWSTDAWERVIDVKANSNVRGWLNIVAPPEEGHSYVIGADTGHGVGKDSSTLAVFDRNSRRFVAYVKDNTIKPDKLAECLILTGLFYNTAYLAPEFNGPGVLTTHLIVKSGYPRLYYNQRFNTAMQKWTDQPGFSTDQKTRGRIIDMFDVAIENNSLEIPIKAILDETFTFVLDERKKRADHLPGCHDDLLFAAMIAFFVDGQVPMDAKQAEDNRVISWGDGPPRVPDDLNDDSPSLEDLDLLFM